MDSTTRVTASEFQNSFGMLSDKARRQPVVITKHGHDSLVVLPIEEWERLKRRDRHVGLTSEAPDEWIEAVRAAPSPPEYTPADADPK
jgi:prevent-host-death family protein